MLDAILLLVFGRSWWSFWEQNVGRLDRSLLRVVDRAESAKMAQVVEKPAAGARDADSVREVVTADAAKIVKAYSTFGRYYLKNCATVPSAPG